MHLDLNLGHVKRVQMNLKNQSDTRSFFRTYPAIGKEIHLELRPRNASYQKGQRLRCSTTDSTTRIHGLEQDRHITRKSVAASLLAVSAHIISAKVRSKARHIPPLACSQRKRTGTTDSLGSAEKEHMLRAKVSLWRGHRLLPLRPEHLPIAQ